MIYIVRYLLLVLYTVLWGIPAVVLSVVDRSGRGVLWIARQWISWILASFSIRVEAEGLENIDPRQPCVYMTNHQSAVDVAALVQTLRVPWRFVAKRELTWIPIFGWILALHGHVIIDRRDNERAVRSLQNAARRILGGMNVIIFPEGTRSPTGELREFKSGGFHLAIEAQVPIVPATISGSQWITPKGSLRIESGLVKIRYGEAIPTKGLTLGDRQALKQRVRAAIRGGYDPASQQGTRLADRRTQAGNRSPA